jgi:hypothetical protein
MMQVAPRSESLVQQIMLEVDRYQDGRYDVAQFEAALEKAISKAFPFEELFDTFAARALEISISKGFFKPAETFGDHVALAHSELSEALNAFRTHGFEDYYSLDESSGAISKPEGVRSELADTVIRVASLSAHRGLRLGAKLSEKLAYNATRAHRHGGKRL